MRWVWWLSLIGTGCSLNFADGDFLNPEKTTINEVVPEQLLEGETSIVVIMGADIPEGAVVRARWADENLAMVAAPPVVHRSASGGGAFSVAELELPILPSLALGETADVMLDVVEVDNDLAGASCRPATWRPCIHRFDSCADSAELLALNEGSVTVRGPAFVVTPLITSHFRRLACAQRSCAPNRR